MLVQSTACRPGVAVTFLKLPAHTSLNWLDLLVSSGGGWMGARSLMPPSYHSVDTCHWLHRCADSYGNFWSWARVLKYSTVRFATTSLQAAGSVRLSSRPSRTAIGMAAPQTTLPRHSRFRKQFLSKAGSAQYCVLVCGGPKDALPRGTVYWRYSAFRASHAATSSPWPSSSWLKNFLLPSYAIVRP